MAEPAMKLSGCCTCLCCRADKMNLLVKAIQDIVDANRDFRKGMPDDWDGDPLQDACDAAAKLITTLGGPAK